MRRDDVHCQDVNTAQKQTRRNTFMKAIKTLPKGIMSTKETRTKSGQSKGLISIKEPSKPKGLKESTLAREEPTKTKGSKGLKSLEEPTINSIGLNGLSATCVINW